MTATVRLARSLLVVIAMVVATIILGWLGVLFVAVLFATIDRGSRVAGEAGFAAAVAWLGLFIGNAVVPGSGLVPLIGRAMGLPWLVLPLLTILFPAMLAWSGATVAIGIAHLLGRRRRFDTPVRAG